METIDSSISQLDRRRRDFDADHGQPLSPSRPEVFVGQTPVGPGHPTFVIAEIVNYAARIVYYRRGS